MLITFFSLLANNSLKVNYNPNGELQGQVTDSITKEGISFATVCLLNDSGTQVQGCQTDIDGNYVIKPIAPGIYSIKVSSLGYKELVLKNINISAGKITFQNAQLSSGSKSLSSMLISGNYKIATDHTQTGSAVKKEEIQHMCISRSNPNSIAGQTAGVFKSESILDMDINGSRGYSQEYDVGSMPINGTINIQQNNNDKLHITGHPSQKHPNKNPPPPPVQYTTPYYSNEQYATLIENEFKRVSDEPLSTFSIDVDDASYTNFRRYVQQGILPPKNAIRIEEFINFFHYDYPQPVDEHPFSISMEQAVCPWNTEHKIVGIGIKGKTIGEDSLPPSNLVFLIDVSGSMSDADKLPLVKTCFRLLVKNLRPIDRVAIVVYAGNAGLVLPSTSGKNKNRIYDAIDALDAGGSTAGGAGINLAYAIAKENFIKDGNNRVILATDGDFNVGVASDQDLLTLIESKRNDRIFLTTLGFGQGNYKDEKMELLADKGNGNYSYVDCYEQGRKIFESGLTSTLYTIAKDVKFQVEFNPAIVKGYRLIGYENRLLNKEDFNDDKKDAGEIGAGHTVTAFYEIIPAGSKEIISNVDSLKYQVVNKSTIISSDEILTLKMRYKEPDKDISKLIVKTLKNNPQPIENCSEKFRFAAAVAEFSIMLRDSKFKSNASFAQALDLAKKSKGLDEDGTRAEFIKLASAAKELSEDNQASGK